MFSFMPKTRHDARLIMVTPEQRAPALLMQAVLPFGKDFFQLNKIRCRQLPFFAVWVIDFQVMEIKHHRQFTTILLGIVLAMSQCGGGHFPNRHAVAWYEYIAG